MPSTRSVRWASVVLALVASTSWANVFPPHNILKGLSATGFRVTVEPFDPDTKKSGLTEGALAKVVQSRLQKASVPFNPKSNQELFVRIVVLTSNDVTGKVLGYGAHTELSLREQAQLKRDTTVTFMAPTWFKGNVTVANPQAFKAQVVQSLAALTDQFIKDFHGAK
jgi:hypothetical protein